MAKKVIKLMGEPIQNEDDKAAEVITPGHLVNFDSSGDLIKHATAAADHALTIAFEREEMGNGIDVNYAIGDTVKVGHFWPGQRFLGFIASGQNITKGNRMESAGNGTFRVQAGSGVAKCRSLDTTGAVTVLTRIRLEGM